jgi:hypothetical protein
MPAVRAAEIRGVAGVEAAMRLEDSSKAGIRD